MRVRVVRSARKHRIGNAHILAVMIGSTPTVIGDQSHYTGRDDRGIELHIIAVPDDRRDGLVVIHAMPVDHTRRKGTP